jgi:hypothetical protein
MKLSQILIPLLASKVGAIDRTSLVSSIHDTVSKANIPGVLAVAAEKSGELVTETLPRAAAQGAKWVAANPGTAAAAGVGLVLVAAPALVTAPVLGAVGFGANGIVAGVLALSFPRFLQQKSCLPVSMVE